MEGDCVSGDCKNGIGTFRYKNGDQYTGAYNNGNMYGKGKYISSDFLYEGDFVNNVYEGNGTYIYKNNVKKIRYEGEFKNDMFNGYGVLTYKDGKTQDGQWKDDKFLGILIGYLKGTPAYWDAINTITIGNEKYEIDKQHMDSIILVESTGKSYPVSESAITKPTRYFYIKDSNYIIGVVRFEKSETGYPSRALGEKVFLDTDEAFLNHLNRNQHNKPAKLPLTHFEGAWYYDTNNCLWELYPEYASVYHNPKDKYINLKFVRKKPSSHHLLKQLYIQARIL
jgi:hypothetical protein